MTPSAESSTNPLETREKLPDNDAMRILWIAVFGLTGVFSRYFIDLRMVKHGLPSHWGTFAINLLGSLLITLVYVMGSERGWLNPDIRTGLTVGLLGGFTTFSSYSLQSALLLESGGALTPLFYMLGSPILGIALAFSGLRLFRAIF